MKLLHDGRGYRQAYKVRDAAGELPTADALNARYPLLTITPDSVSLDDAAVERWIDQQMKSAPHTVDLTVFVKQTLTYARQQRAEWLADLGHWYTANILGR